MDAHDQRADDAATIGLLGRECLRLRGLLERIAPVVERKVSAGSCVHDVWTDEEWRDYQRAITRALRPADERDDDVR